MAKANTNETRPRPKNALSLSAPLRRRVGAEAARADASSDRTSGHGHTAHLEVGQEPPVDPVLGVTDVMSVLRLFAAYRATLGHEPPSDWNLTDQESRHGD